MASSTPLSAEEITSYTITPTSAIEIAQTAHRLALFAALPPIPPSSTILELGCGQGTTTIILASLVPSGHVSAIDPAPPTYGAPYTLEQAQNAILASEIGGRITFCRDDVKGFVAKNKGKKWDLVVLIHCIWYFPDKSVFEGIMEEIKAVTDRVILAEYALTATHPDAEPHVLAARTISALEKHNPTSMANIRCALSPAEIKSCVAKVGGWELTKEDVVVPEEGLLDGRWETGTVMSDGFTKSIDEFVKDGDENAAVKALREEVVAAMEKLEGRKARTMDVWVANFEATK